MTGNLLKQNKMKSAIKKLLIFLLFNIKPKKFMKLQDNLNPGMHSLFSIDNQNPIHSHSSDLVSANSSAEQYYQSNRWKRSWSPQEKSLCIHHIGHLFQAFCVSNHQPHGNTNTRGLLPVFRVQRHQK